MNNSPPISKKRLVIGVVSLFFVMVVVVAIYILANRHSGEIKVVVSVLPEDANILVDGEQVDVNNIWVTPGEHEFIAEKDGFESDSVSRNIDEKDTVVTLLPGPVSDEAIEWANQPDIQTQLEGLSGQKADERGGYIVDKNPIINMLPYVDIAGPFKIDYGYHGADNTTTYLIIHKTTPDGRQAALEWIRKQGYDPTTLDIRFTDFENPLFGGQS